MRSDEPETTCLPPARHESREDGEPGRTPASLGGSEDRRRVKQVPERPASFEGAADEWWQDRFVASTARLVGGCPGAAPTDFACGRKKLVY